MWCLKQHSDLPQKYTFRKSMSASQLFEISWALVLTKIVSLVTKNGEWKIL